MDGALFIFDDVCGLGRILYYTVPSSPLYLYTCNEIFYVANPIDITSEIRWLDDIRQKTQVFDELISPNRL